MLLIQRRRPGKAARDHHHLVIARGVIANSGANKLRNLLNFSRAARFALFIVAQQHRNRQAAYLARHRARHRHFLVQIIGTGIVFRCLRHRLLHRRNPGRGRAARPRRRGRRGRWRGHHAGRRRRVGQRAGNATGRAIGAVLALAGPITLFSTQSAGFVIGFAGCLRLIQVHISLNLRRKIACAHQRGQQFGKLLPVFVLDPALEIDPRLGRDRAAILPRRMGEKRAHLIHNRHHVGLHARH